MIESQLREQMLAATAHDVPPPDLLRRVQVGVRRTQSRRVAVVGGIAVTAVAAVATSASLAAGGVDSGIRDAVMRVDTAAPARGEAVGPSDAELRAAQWFSYVSQPDQPGGGRPQESRWESRDGRHVLQYGDGPPELINESSSFPLGPRGVSFDELLAMPADPHELNRRMLGAEFRAAPDPTSSPGPSDAEVVLDQVRQLLGRSPALRDVRRALVDAALQHDGVTLTEGEQDSRGRPAVLLELDDDKGEVLRLWLDPVGFRLLEQQAVVGPEAAGIARGDGDEPFSPGDVTYREVFLSWGTESPPAQQPS